MVEWKKLGDICEIIRGNGVQKTDFVESGVGCIHYGQIYTHYGPFTYTTNKFVSKDVFEKARKASRGDIIMTDTSENVEDICKSVAYLGEEDIAVSNHALILKHKQNPKFLTYSTLTNSFLNQKRKYVFGAKVSGIKPENLAQIKIYLPSLSEQQRIVGILDTFTSSIENLKEQIAQRRKQYEYYRDQLLDLKGKEGVETKTLGEICDNLDYMRKPITSSKRKAGLFPYYGASGIVDYVEGYIFDGDYLLVSEDGANLVARTYPIAFSIKGKNWVNNHAHVLSFDSKITQKFVEIYLNMIDLSPWINGAAQPKLNQANLNTIDIPVPSLSEQQRIVSILDTFEASIRNLEQQLALREKQYEYYRNNLLTFE